MVLVFFEHFKDVIPRVLLISLLRSELSFYVDSLKMIDIFIPAAFKIVFYFGNTYDVPRG